MVLSPSSPKTDGLPGKNATVAGMGDGLTGGGSAAGSFAGVSAVANELLGFPADARLLILNNDDLGMYHAVNVAITSSIEEGIGSSCSLMVPCPWSQHAMHLLRERPETPFGIHLTLVCDTVNYGWGPVTPADRVPSLLDGAGQLYRDDQVSELMARASLDEVELEFRAQVEAVLSAGLEPTHLDWHCLHDGGRPDIFGLTMELAEEHGLALRVSHRSAREQLRSLGLPCNDHDLLDSYDLEVDDKPTRYARLLRELPVGLTEWAVHAGLGNAEARAIDDGWQVRQTDYDFLISREARQIVQEEGITVIDYRPLQEVWRSRARK
jgi:chitin disaccharide deacetylase